MAYLLHAPDKKSLRKCMFKPKNACLRSDRNVLVRSISLLQVARSLSGETLQNFIMADRLRMDDEIDFASLEAPIAAIVEACTRADASRVSDGVGDVFVCCNLGINRSPTLVLAFLLSRGLSLRESYRSVLRVRPGIDPLPPYRRALGRADVGGTVAKDEPFALHISELLANGLDVDEAMATRRAAIDSLLAEASAPVAGSSGSPGSRQLAGDEAGPVSPRSTLEAAND